MNKLKKIIFICLISLTGITAWAYDDLDGLAKYAQKPIKYDRSKDLEYERRDQFPQQRIETFTPPLTYKDQMTDRAVDKNEERLKKMLDEQKKTVTTTFDDWIVQIPKEHRLVVELASLALFISFFSIMFYRQSIKRREEKRREEEKERSRYI